MGSGVEVLNQGLDVCVDVGDLRSGCLNWSCCMSVVVSDVVEKE